MKRRIRVALVQMSVESNFAANVDKSLAAIGEAADGGANLVCFPEIHLSPFFPQYTNSDASEYLVSIEDEAIRLMRERGRERGIVVVPNLYLSEGGHRFDASPVIDTDGSIVGISKMVHVVQAPLYYEQDYYTPSDVGFQTFVTEVAAVGVAICFDRHFPESFRVLKLQGANIVLIPTANHVGEPLEKFEWEVRVAAMQNQVYVAMCNRVGREGAMTFCGESIVADPNGDVVAKADASEQILYADLDLALADDSLNERSYLRLRNSRFCSLEAGRRHWEQNDRVAF